jgi:DNA transformation protein and related proteins
MSVTEGFVEFVVDQLQGCGPISWRRMFGGVGIYAADVFFAILARDVLYLKVDDTNRGDFERVGSRPFRPSGEDTEVMQYYNVPVAVLESADDLLPWARKAIAVAKAARAGTRTRTRARPSATKGRGAKRARTEATERREPRSLR